METPIITVKPAVPSAQLWELVKNACKDAVLAQSACNLSGIVHALHRHIDTIWDLAHLVGHGTDWVNEHPVCVLFAEQIAHLTKIYSSPASMERWRQAMDYCEKVRDGQITDPKYAYKEEA